MAEEGDIPMKRDNGPGGVTDDNPYRGWTAGITGGGRLFPAVMLLLALLVAVPVAAAGADDASPTVATKTSDAARLNDGIAAWDAGDYDTAAAILKPLADAGDPQAQYLIAAAFANGKGLKKNQKQATAYFRRAAEQKHRDANLVLGTRYLEGNAGFQDADLAEKHLRTAAFLGSVEAQFVLGYAFSYGNYPTFRKDFASAASFFEMAASQQHRASQFFLSTLLYKRKETDIFDPARGLMWNIILAKETEGNFSEQSISNIDLLRREMPKEKFEILHRKASRLARRCINSEYEDCGWEGR